MVEKKFVTVYHGTTKSRASQILCDGEIRITSENNINYSTTSCGFVYVTTCLCDAMDFSSRRAENGVSTINVFRITVDASELETDTDEIKWRSTLSPGGTKTCYRIRRNLKIGKDVDAIFQKTFGRDSSAFCGGERPLVR